MDEYGVGYLTPFDFTFFFSPHSDLLFTDRIVDTIALLNYNKSSIYLSLLKKNI